MADLDDIISEMRAGILDYDRDVPRDRIDSAKIEELTKDVLQRVPSEWLLAELHRRRRPREHDDELDRGLERLFSERPDLVPHMNAFLGLKEEEPE